MDSVITAEPEGAEARVHAVHSGSAQGVLGMHATSTSKNTHSLPCCGCHRANGSSREAGFGFAGFLRPRPTCASSLNTGCFHLNRWCGQNSPAHQWRQRLLCGAGSWSWGLGECVLWLRVLFRCDPCRHHSRLSLIRIISVFSSPYFKFRQSTRQK